MTEAAMGAVADVSVVLATRDRPALLWRCLEAIEAQTQPPLEVLVVDDASGPETAAVLDQMAARLPLRRVRLPRRSGPGRARNAGWSRAQGTWVAFTDDDCRPEPGWLAALRATATENRVVVGRTRPDPAGDPPRSAFDRSMEAEGLTHRFSTCNILYPLKALRRLGGFDPEIDLFGEDTDLGQRAVGLGLVETYAADAIVNHVVHHMTAVAALRERWRCGEVVRLARRYPRLRDEIWHGRFWKHYHPRVFEALAGVALTPVSPVFLFLTTPWFKEAGVRLRHDLGRDLEGADAARELASLFLLDSVEALSCAWGSVRHRTLFL
ncbi:MAG TPA: glycosyltransferase family A protein, partial [Candidatus Dormibacteraeota bacterium]|nr:glycosyltransferase family A protein [Candidatus Dormibacteraeota bacterium]